MPLSFMLLPLLLGTNNVMLLCRCACGAPTSEQASLLQVQTSELLQVQVSEHAKVCALSPHNFFN
jgi:hypothetical protein